jgi:hypothetical protein
VNLTHHPSRGECGSSLGTVLAGSVMVAAKLPAGKPFAVALTVMLVITLIGLVPGILIPRTPIDGTALPKPGHEAGCTVADIVTLADRDRQKSPDRG